MRLAALNWVFLGVILISLTVAGTVCSTEEDQEQPAIGVSGPFSVEDSLRLFQLSDDRLKVELVAAEPQVQDPVAAQFDEDGRLWVVEMGDYPHGPPAGELPKSRIRILDDRDGDGRFETATVFAEQLLFATELQPWKGGAIVTLAGEVAYLRDTNGDGQADQRETWYRGFAQENSQLRANHPRLGLDGWIYLSNGLRGGTVANVRIPDAPPVPLAGKDFRFHPTTFAAEAITGVGQFGLAFDDFDNRFICSNRNPLMHVVLEERYIQRNPKYAPSAARHDVGRAGEESRIYAVSRAWTTSNLHAGQFTAACGVLIYRGSALPGEFAGNGFTCDPTGNLVHREVMVPAGATFTCRLQDKPVEFLASPDEWFRPVNLFNGPDGALYIVDMYRAVIEHPDFVPEELKKRPDLMLGVDRGRIWRVVAKDARRPSVPKLSGETGSQLAARLASSGWVGDTAFRILYERREKAIVAELETIASRGEGVGATRALWLLQHLDALTDPILQSALESTAGRVREHAIRLAESRLETNPAWRRQVARLAVDGDARVRFQLAMSLAPIQDATEVAALRQIAAAGSNDEWTRRAVAIAAGERAGELATAVLNTANADQQPLAPDTIRLLTELFGVVSAHRKQVVLVSLLGAICRLDSSVASPRVQGRVVLSFADSLGRSGSDLNVLGAMLSDLERERLKQVFHQAQVDLRDATELELRGAAALLLGFDESSAASLVQLVRYSSSAANIPTELRLRCLAALARQPQLELLGELLNDWPRESPGFRRGLLDVLLARPDRTQLLLGAIESGTVKPSELESSVSNRLLKHGQPAVRKRAEELLASLIPADRQKVLTDYQSVLKIKSDPIRGRQVFAKNCSTCHRIGELGVNVAPDISDSRVKQPEQLLTDILQPNRAIDNNYLSYSLVTSDGLTLTGVIASETGTSVTLRQQEGKEATFLRSNIEELRSNGVSLMPEGMEKNIPPQEMADLIGFIKNWRYLDGRTPLNP